ncbi:VOC family protein [Arthrobacter sp. SDTb3-6]|uniref:VOC family protein n=1 Tax=Arthrobacter sp. SDTb3-6 TaxID=2713571 RepID=UPI00159D26BD|nr:VOC family protein [Arthrobacter sp. SDTb3-6]NVM98960.1 VOC family protein [Arthrobacter sp. SDTb3-6]
MLRVRPVLFTSRLDEYAALLTALGLACTENHGGWRVLDCGDGKVGLHRAERDSPQDGTTAPGFELRDRNIFVRRTLADGTHAELVDSDHGPAARVTAPDGFSFLADPVTDLASRRPGALAVVQLWHTPDVDAARKVLADIGARPLPPRPVGSAVFRAKNGGLVALLPAGASGAGLALEYDGGLAALGARLAAAGVPAAQGRGTLDVQTPCGGTLQVFAAAAG